jgi:hypothetical protein
VAEIIWSAQDASGMVASGMAAAIARRTRSTRGPSQASLIKSERRTASAQARATRAEGKLDQAKRDRRKERATARRDIGMNFAGVLFALAAGVVIMGQLVRVKKSWGPMAALVSGFLGVIILFTAATMLQAYAAFVFFGGVFNYITKWASETDLIPGDFEDQFIETTATEKPKRGEDGR